MKIPYFCCLQEDKPSWRLFICLLLPDRVLAQQGKTYLDSLLKTAELNYPLVKAKS